MMGEKKGKRVKEKKVLVHASIPTLLAYTQRVYQLSNIHIM